ncbi:MAG: alanine dehydrogenase [Saprospiraceae bacterium]|jgi:saccharopine dehydrogenase (NAD+, L-lysine-forming)|uniref:NAD(P)-dependent oxidoreductase n=1 Tax=Candidatus Brachybacter algidus TaxID=2982024 RepID=UPI001B67FA47|nr:NAD(P)-dependent oxidoreductase [Candidatus Brachybacter algidus]MBP7305285.1 alanine dehydrogenase [Saprospiraceae bacterium]MBK6449256.1 alanine dehydrogenase [Candidatus Brachybacter algidus]MBK8747387.1 alanine dehydrogenase [Candidatus Brachybacter algidus]MBK9025331.1 alanine dehydrogenase [Candidatus Brachybacter algidus]MBK9398203.1 alanine dehydrogenase [Candidatus Brachybacter algidus]
MKIGILCEGKVPHDDRVALTPKQCKLLMGNPYNFDIVVQPSSHRCYTDEEYFASGVPVMQDISQSDIILGVKEVPIKDLMPHKKYFFFSHTIKKQAHNRKLLQAILQKNITLIDYETLVDDHGGRLIAFGKYAGIVGAHNGLWTYGQRTGLFDWPRLKDLHDFEQARTIYHQTTLPPVKIVLTGSGRVAYGAISALKDMNIQEVSPLEFLKQEDFETAVFTHLTSADYVKHKDNKIFVKKDFYQNPQDYVSIFKPYAEKANIFLNCIYWDTRAPAFFTMEEIADASFNIEVIGDITCDIAPESSVPTTLKASTIDEPVFGIDTESFEITAPYKETSIDVMSIDNLPNELPRDASRYFGDQFIKVIIPELMAENSKILDYATIAKDGALTPHFMYLNEYVHEAAG